jgi:hypothetical protein
MNYINNALDFSVLTLKSKGRLVFLLLSIGFLISGCATSFHSLNQDTKIESDEYAAVIFKSTDENFVFWLDEGIPQNDIVSQKSKIDGSSARITIANGYGIQKVKANTTYYIKSYHLMVGDKLEGNYTTCGGKNTIYFNTTPRATHYISDVSRRFNDGKLSVNHRKGNFGAVEKYVRENHPNLGISLRNEIFTRATTVTSCENPTPTVIPIYIPSKRR